MKRAYSTATSYARTPCTCSFRARSSFSTSASHGQESRREDPSQVDTVRRSNSFQPEPVISTPSGSRDAHKPRLSSNSESDRKWQPWQQSSSAPPNLSLSEIARALEGDVDPDSTEPQSGDSEVTDGLLWPRAKPPSQRPLPEMICSTAPERPSTSTPPQKLFGIPLAGKGKKESLDAFWDRIESKMGSPFMNSSVTSTYPEDQKTLFDAAKIAHTDRQKTKALHSSMGSRARKIDISIQTAMEALLAQDKSSPLCSKTAEDLIQSAPEDKRVLCTTDWRLRAPSRSEWGSGKDLGVGVMRIAGLVKGGEIAGRRYEVRRRRPDKRFVLAGDPGYDALVQYRKQYDGIIDLEEKANRTALTEKLSASKGAWERDVEFRATWRPDGWRGIQVAELVAVNDAGVGRRYRQGELVRMTSTQQQPSTSSSTQNPQGHRSSAYHQGYVLDCSDTGKEVNLAFESKFDLRSSYRIDPGFDGTAFQRQREAIDCLQHDPEYQRYLNQETLRRIQDGKLQPSGSRSLNLLSLKGTELRDLLLEGFAPEEEKSKPFRSPTRASKLLGGNQFINSWVKRHNTPEGRPFLTMPGDPDLGLDESQVRAIALALGERLSVIQGPPGTGKTQTIVAAIRLLKEHFQVPFPILACGSTHVSVDNLISSLAEVGLNPLRAGNNIRISNTNQPYTFTDRMRTHPQAKRLENIKNEWDTLQLEEVRLRANKEPLADQARLASLRRQVDILKGRYYTLHRNIEAEVFGKTDVVCCTNYGAFLYSLTALDFPMVFIDEAAMCNEPSTLIPLMRGSRQAVLIGDHMQLPAITQSLDILRKKLDKSMFERLINSKSTKKAMLRTQYRMVPEIAAFPNESSYDSSLIDAPFLSTIEPPSSKFLVPSTEEEGRLHPISFLDHFAHERAGGGHSVTNPREADLVIEVIIDLLVKNPTLPAKDIGIISPYVGQMLTIWKKIRDISEMHRWFGDVLPLERLRELNDVEVMTVDGFQGRQKEVVILSTARCNHEGTIGFLADRRRLNVALTRAMRALFVIGNADTLGSSQTWVPIGNGDSEEELEPKRSIWQEYVTWLRGRGLIRKVLSKEFTIKW